MQWFSLRVGEWIAHRANIVLFVVLLIVSGAWGFIKIADEVIEGDTQHFDDRIIHALHRPDPDWQPRQSPPDVPIGPRWLQECGRDITALGGVAVLLLVTAAVAGYLLMLRKFHAVALVLVASGGGLVLSTLLKRFFERPRPDITHSAYVYTSSFPSGHSMMSAVVYLTLGSLLTRLSPHRSGKLYFLIVAILLTGLIGVSRIYMGVHYPTDVLAGWSAGLVWAMLCWLAARWLQRRGQVETDMALPAQSEPQHS